MEYNILGKTGLKVSRLCFGTLTVGPLQASLTVDKGAEIIAHAVDMGINFFDTAQLYKTYPYIKKAMDMRPGREFIISGKTYAYTRELAVSAVEEARKELGREYIDIFMLHEQESEHTLRGHMEALEALLEYKARGIIGAVGISTHYIAGVYAGLEKELDAIHPLLNKNGLGIVDGNSSEMEKAIEMAYKKDTGIYLMKILGGGNLFKNARECFDYAFNFPFAHSIAVGMQSIEEVNANCKYLEEGCFDNGDLQVLSAKKRQLHIDYWCDGCGECSRICPQNAIAVEEKALCDHEKCILCGYCAGACPQWAIKVV